MSKTNFYYETIPNVFSPLSSLTDHRATPPPATASAVLPHLREAAAVLPALFRGVLPDYGCGRGAVAVLLALFHGALPNYDCRQGQGTAVEGRGAVVVLPAPFRGALPNYCFGRGRVGKAGRGGVVGMAAAGGGGGHAGGGGGEEGRGGNENISRASKETLYI